MVKRIVCTVISVLMAATALTGCSKNGTAKVYNTQCEIKNLESQTIAQDGELELLWNEKGKFVALHDKSTDKMWSTVPYEYFESGGTSDNINSPLNITVVNAAKAQWDTVSGYAESVKKDRVSAEKTDNGIKVTYYFDNYLISIPVEYKLEKGKMTVSLNPAEIVEEGDKVLLSVALAPFLCSAPNVSENAYLFVPSGSGGLMYVDQRAEGTRKYTAEVYGTDGSRLLPEEITNETKAHMPIYGVKDNDSALFAVISEGDNCAEIYAEAGNRRTDYSTVYPIFYLRGYDVVETDQWLWGYRDLNRISDNLVKNNISVEFYPLSGENADYNGMAAKYREFLFGKEPKKTEAQMFSLNILGGVTYRSADWGIPHKKLHTLTTYKQAENIITELSEKTGYSSAVNLQGFTSSGIDIGDIGGGFKLVGDYGSKKDFANLIKKAEKLGINLAMDFDIVRFNTSSNGFSYIMDSAKSATLRTVNKYGIKLPLRAYDSVEYRLLKRAEIDTAVDKLIAFSEKNLLKSVGLSSFSSFAYSDFDEERFSVKGNIASQYAENVEKIKKNGMKVYASDANAYAAVAADVLLDVPTDNGEYLAFDASVPFYQMVFGGIKPMYSNALNIAADSQKAVMQAVSSGVHFGFTVVENYDTVCASSKTAKLYATVVSSVQPKLIELVTEHAEFYESISGCGIKEYNMLENGITETVFDNGVKVYANTSASSVETDIGSFEPYGIIIHK